jgi:hypothetical protein
MKKNLIIISFIFLNIKCLAQENKRLFNKLSIEPAIGLRLSSAFGLVDVQLSGLVQYHVNKRFSLASHNAFSFDLHTFKAFKNINPKYSFTAFQKFGIGMSAFAKHSEHTFFMMAGAKFFTYSANINNSKLEDNKQTKFHTIALDRGVLYNLKIGRKSPYFSGRIYLPFFDGKWNAIENSAFEFGAGFKLK